MKQFCSKTRIHGGEGTFFSNIFPSKIQTRMCTRDQIIEVDVTEDTNANEDSYFGWLDNDGSISMIFPKLFLLNMCFSWGAEAEQKSGSGKVIRVNVVERKATNE